MADPDEDLPSSAETVERAERRLKEAHELLAAAIEEADLLVDVEPAFLEAQARLLNLEGEASALRAIVDTLASAERFGDSRLHSDASGRRILLDPRHVGPRLAQVSREAGQAYRRISEVRDAIIERETATYRISCEEAASSYARARARFESDERARRAADAKSLVAEAQRGTQPRHQPPIRQPDGLAIKQIVLDRGICQLVHFTHLSNLRSILRLGIVPRAELERRGDLPCRFNDSTRADRSRDHSCLTITRANYRMLFRYMKQEMGGEDEWCILFIKPEVLWELPCLFCTTNAARSGALAAARVLGHSAAGLSAMFADPVATPCGLASRIDLFGRSPSAFHTSDPQAEVLVAETIPPRYLTGAAVSTQRAFDEAAAAVRGAGAHLDLRVNPSAFKYRCDWRWWKAGA